MKVGDAVMFTSNCSYSRWFFGHLGIVESTNYAKDGKLHCRVRWMQPVKYFDRMTKMSDFCADKFTLSK